MPSSLPVAILAQSASPMGWMDNTASVMFICVFGFLAISAIASSIGLAYTKAATHRADVQGIVDLAQQGYSAEEIESLLKRKDAAD